MVAVLKQNATEEQIKNVIKWLESRGLTVAITRGEFYTILGLIGDTSKLDIELLEGLEIVESVKRVSEPFKTANRKFHPDDSIIEIGEDRPGGTLKIGGPHFQIMAGPCAVESPGQILGIAKSVNASGAAILRGGAFKPRTSPYSFQGLRAEGIEMLLEAKKQTGMPIVSEIMDANHLPLFEHIDIIQVGARNMQNFELLKELGMLQKPILLKRGLANTLQELLMSAEYIMAGGNHNVILCERGIRTFETYTRNTLDLSAIPMLRELTHLPVVIDPSHATGISRLVPSMALAATAAGANGLIIEVHNDPLHALSDGGQSLTPEQFEKLADKIHKIREVVAS